MVAADVPLVALHLFRAMNGFLVQGEPGNLCLVLLCFPSFIMFLFRKCRRKMNDAMRYLAMKLERRLFMLRVTTLYIVVDNSYSCSE